MANTTLANLKIGALRRAGNHYNSNDSALLTLAGGLINDTRGQRLTEDGFRPFLLAQKIGRTRPGERRTQAHEASGRRFRIVHKHS